MAELYGVTTDFLLGREPLGHPNPTQPIPVELLPVFHGKPVWSKTYGWMLVNAAERKLVFPNGTFIPFLDAAELLLSPPPFSETDPPYTRPLSKSETSCREEIWLEPISSDSNLRNELRGWYQVKNRFVQNEYGNRFYLDTYGAKWLAFQSEIEES